jgi:hypothetical protein
VACRFSVILSGLVLSVPLVFGADRSASAAPLLESVFPLSCQIGKQVTVTLAGKELAATDALVFSIPDVTAKRADSGRFIVSVAAEANSQDCDVWCVVDGQLSNPRRFVVTAQPSIDETGKNDDRNSAQTMPFPGAVDGRLESAAKLDWFQFEAKAGQTISLSCRSRTLDGSTKPSIALFDPAGREIGHSTGRRREPLLHRKLTGTGTYLIRVVDSAYRSTSGSFYRLELFSEPVIVAAWPDLVQRKGSTELEFYTFERADAPASLFQLAGSRTLLDVAAEKRVLNQNSMRPFWHSTNEEFETQNVTPADWPSLGAARVRLTDREVSYEDENATESTAKSQRLPVPVLLNGRFNKRGDVDWFSFEAKKDEALRVDIYGDRLGHQMDVDAAIMDASGKTLITFPDATAPKNLPPVLTQTSLDVSGIWKAPADGEFFLVVRDLYGSSLFGVNRSYVVSLRRSQPSFRLVVTPPDEKAPAGYSIPRNGRTAIRLSLVRRDGFNDAVRIGLSDSSLKAGLTLGETWIGRGESSGVAILSNADNSKSESAVRFLELTGGTETDELPVMVQARAVTLLRAGSTEGRVMERLPVSVSSKLPLDVTLAVAGEVVAGEKLNVELKTVLSAGKLKSDMAVEFSGLPTGTKAPATALKLGTQAVPIQISVPAKTLPGRYSVAVAVKATVVSEPIEKEAKAKEQQIVVWSNAVSFDVKPPASAEKSVEK